ncbi:MAG: MarR family winged helix-turn-helix transcriptional regulator [Nocardioidaceae bacterium]
MGETECDQGRDDVTEAFDEVIRLVIRHLTDHRGLTFTAIMCLGRLGRDGPTRLTTLGAAEGVSQPSMSQLVQRLERQGLVVRIRDPQDGRASRIAISDAGRTLVADRLRDRHDRLAGLLTTLSPEDDASLRLAMHVARPIVRRLIETTRRSDTQATKS